MEDLDRDLDEQIAIMEVRLRKLKEAKKAREEINWQRHLLYQPYRSRTEKLVDWFVSLLRKKSFLLKLIILYVLGVLFMCLVLFIGCVL